MKTTMKNVIKETMKNIATECSELGIVYERKDSKDTIYASLKIGTDVKIEIEISKETGLYSCWIDNIPTSFHYPGQVWMGTTYNIKKMHITCAVMNMLWKNLVDLPHAGHYEKTK